MMAAGIVKVRVGLCERWTWHSEERSVRRLTRLPLAAVPSGVNPCAVLRRAGQQSCSGAEQR